MSTTHITPTPGRIVWYRGADGEIRPAIVIKGNGPFNADLYVFPLHGADTEFGNRSTVTHADPEQEPGCLTSWHWMPYQKQQAEKHAQADQLAAHAAMVKESGWTPAPLESKTYADGTRAIGTAPLPDVSPVEQDHRQSNMSGAIHASNGAIASDQRGVRGDFGYALDWLKAGQRVARAGWNGAGQWVALGSGNPLLDASQFWNPHARAHAKQNGGGATVLPYFILKTAQGAILMGWSPSQSDALAEDWLIVE